MKLSTDFVGVLFIIMHLKTVSFPLAALRAALRRKLEVELYQCSKRMNDTNKLSTELKSPCNALMFKQ